MNVQKKMYRLLSPKGVEIVGVLEEIRAVALVSGFNQRSDGGWDPDYDGESEVDWDSQRPKMENGAMMVVDEGGLVWSVAECTCKVI